MSGRTVVSGLSTGAAAPSRFYSRLYQDNAGPRPTWPAAVFILLLAGLSGMAGLAHQMVWARRLVDLLGASPLTFSKVVGAFFLGLSAGAAVTAIRSNPVRHPWRKLAMIEIVIAVLALPVLMTPLVAETLYHSPGISIWLKHLLPFLLVTPPAIAMGFVLPWMIRALPQNLRARKNLVVWIYASNTLGGVFGIIAVLMFALPSFGLTGTGMAVCCLNVVVASGVLLLGHLLSADRESFQSSSQTEASVAPASPPRPTARNAQFALLTFFSGFFVLSLEVVLQHQFAQVTINSLFSGGTVLAWVLLSLAAGSALVPWVTKQMKNRAELLRAVLVGAGILCAIEPFIFLGLREHLSIIPYELPPGLYMLEVCETGLLVVCPLLLTAGLLFPLLLQGDDSTSITVRRAAVLFAWNGFGGWLGSEVTQHFIAPRFGLWQSVVFIGFGYCLLACAIRRNPFSPTESASEFSQNKWSAWLPIPGGAAILIAFFCAAWLPQVSLRRGEHLAALQVGREGVVATVECAPGDWRMLFNNSYTLGGSKAKINQERQAHLPILLHGDARSIALLGVATGSTTAGAALHPSVERIDAAELSPLVLDYAGKFFGQYNRDVFRDPRVRLFAEDARWMIAGAEKEYDVVIGDLFLPWRTGEGRLFSLEHFQAVRRALKSDGVYCQWLPLFQLTRPQFEAIARTFQQVFPDAIVVRGDFYAELPIIGLVGGRDLSQINWDKVAERCAELRGGEKVTDPLVRHEEGVAMMIAGRLPTLEAGPINTLANAWLEWDCARNIVGMSTPWFIGVPEAEFMQGIQRASASTMPEHLRAAQDSGQFFLTLEVAAKLGLDVYPNLFSQVKDRLPRSLREDRVADWPDWPSRVKPRVENFAEARIASSKF